MSSIASVTPSVFAVSRESVSSELEIRRLVDSSGNVVASIVGASYVASDFSETGACQRDVDALRVAAGLALEGEGSCAFVAASATTVRAPSHNFTKTLRIYGGDITGRLGVLISWPADADDAAKALRFASSCATQGVKLALELPEGLQPASWTMACAMARAIDASVVLVSGRTIVDLYAGRGARGAREMVSRLLKPGAEMYATSIGGPPLQTLCERVGVRVFEQGRRRKSVAGAVASKSHEAAPSWFRGDIARFGVIAAATFGLAACSSVPKPAVPDGTMRVPINDPARIAILQTQAEIQTSALVQRDETRSQVAALQQQVQDLRTAVKLLAVAPQLDTPRVNGGPAGPTFVAIAPAAPTAFGSAIALAANSDSRAVESTREGLIFRVFHPTGAANFAPAGKFAEALRAAVVGGASVEVRGFTDSAVDDGPNRRVATARTSDARDWLIEQGVDPKVIKTRSTSHGRFLADNGTPAGRSLNRRVEIEIRGDTTQAVAILNRKEG
jgi:outer membrane protein OmpA-like peptidoglycan-associated protein